MSAEDPNRFSVQDLTPDDPPESPPDSSPVPPRPMAEMVVESMQLAAGAINSALAYASQQAWGRNASQNRVAMTLIANLPRLLPLMEKYPDPPPVDARYIPACPLCRARPGSHWAHECPSVPKAVHEGHVFDYRKGKMIRYRDLVRDLDPRDYAPARIPRCGICGKGPGAHWPDACPDNPIRDKMFGDRVMPPHTLEAIRAERKEPHD